MTESTYVAVQKMRNSSFSSIFHQNIAYEKLKTYTEKLFLFIFYFMLFLCFILFVSGYNTAMRRSAVAAGQIQQPTMDNAMNASTGLPQHISLHHYYDCSKFC